MRKNEPFPHTHPMPMADSKRSIANAVKHFGLGTFLSRFSGIAREIMMASLFGTHPSVAAFWMAYRFSYLMRRILGEGALNPIFIPHFEMLRTQSSQKAARFYVDLTKGVMLFLFAFILFSEGLLGGFLWFGQPSGSIREIMALSMLFLPGLAFICLYALNSALLHCERFYFLPSAAPACVNVVWAISGFFLLGVPIQNAMQRLSLIVIGSFAVQWMVTLPQAISFLWKNRGYRQLPFTKKEEFFSLARPFFLGVVGVAATQVNTALDAVFARIADPEGPAYLWYAIRLQQLPIAIFGVGILGALLPPLSRALQRGERKKAEDFFQFAYSSCILIMVVATCAFFILGREGLALLYRHGAFTQAALKETTFVLWAYGIGLLPMASVLMFAAPFYALKEFAPTAKAAIAAVFCNVIFNLAFVFSLKCGAAGIALATSFSSLIQAILLFHFLQKKLTCSRLPNFGRSLICGMAGSACALVFDLSAGWISQHGVLYFCLKSTLFCLGALGTSIALGITSMSKLAALMRLRNHNHSNS